MRSLLFYPEEYNFLILYLTPRRYSFQVKNLLREYCIHFQDEIHDPKVRSNLITLRTRQKQKLLSMSICIDDVYNKAAKFVERKFGKFAMLYVCSKADGRDMACPAFYAQHVQISAKIRKMRQLIVLPCMLSQLSTAGGTRARHALRIY